VDLGGAKRWEGTNNDPTHSSSDNGEELEENTAGTCPAKSVGCLPKRAAKGKIFTESRLRGKVVQGQLEKT